MSAWGWSIGLGLFGSFGVIKITALELWGPEWSRLVAEGVMWLGWAALVWWAALGADRRMARRRELELRKLERDPERDHRRD